MDLNNFDFSQVQQLPNRLEFDRLERSMRLLAAAEFAASIRSVAENPPETITVTPLHWNLASQYYLCGAGAGQGCLPDDLNNLELWHITVFPGYIQKLTKLGYSKPMMLAGDFSNAYNALSSYMQKFENTAVVVASGALMLHAQTWLKRFELLGIEVGEQQELGTLHSTS